MRKNSKEDSKDTLESTTKGDDAGNTGHEVLNENKELKKRIDETTDKALHIDSDDKSKSKKCCFVKMLNILLIVLAGLFMISAVHFYNEFLTVKSNELGDTLGHMSYMALGKLIVSIILILVVGLARTLVIARC